MKQVFQIIIRESLQTIYTYNYYLRKHSIQFLQNTTRKIIASSTYKLLSENHFKQNLQNIIREIIENICYKLLTEKSLQTILKIFFQGIVPNNIHAYILLSKESFQTNPTNYYKRNHCKQYLETIIRELFQTILKNYYNRNHSRQYLQTITKEIIANYTFKSLSDISIHFKFNFLFVAHNTGYSFKTIMRRFITNDVFKSCLNPAISKTKGLITYQNTNFSAVQQS